MSRNTRQREAILNVFNGTGIHLTPAEVMAKIKASDDRVSQATVYRNLAYLCEQGKIRKISGNGIECYDGNCMPHDHVICRKCGKIVDVPSFDTEDMETRAALSSGMKILSHAVLYEGLCRECSEKEAE